MHFRLQSTHEGKWIQLYDQECKTVCALEYVIFHKMFMKIFFYFNAAVF